MKKLLPAIRLADKSYLFDNSGIGAGKVFHNFAEVQDGEISLLSDSAPAWFEEYFLKKL